jgi:hypothetical protein
MIERMADRSSSSKRWKLLGIGVLLLVAAAGLLPVFPCPPCHGWCAVEAYTDQGKIPCHVCGDWGWVTLLQRLRYDGR